MAAIVSPIDDGSAAPQRSEGNQPTRRLDGDFDRALNDASLGLLSAGDNEISEDDKLVGELARLAAGNDPVKALEIVSARLAVRREAVSSEKKWALAMMLCVTVLAVVVGYLQSLPRPAAPAAPSRMSHTQRSLKAFDMANKDMNSYLDEDEFADFEDAYDPREKAKHSTLHNCLHAHSSSHRFPIMRVNVAEFAKCLYQS